MSYTATRKESKNSTQLKRTTKMHFDDENLEETFHPSHKNYGFISIGETKTPFPRKQDPVDPILLREHLHKSLLRRADAASLSSDESSDTRLFNMLSSTNISHKLHPFQLPSESFAMKRRKFNEAEFSLAKQRPMSDMIHLPGESVVTRRSRYSERVLSITTDISTFLDD